jgi:hypothetical protein
MISKRLPGLVGGQRGRSPVETIIFISFSGRFLRGMPYSESPSHALLLCVKAVRGPRCGSRAGSVDAADEGGCQDRPTMGDWSEAFLGRMEEMRAREVPRRGLRAGAQAQIWRRG